MNNKNLNILKNELSIDGVIGAINKLEQREGIEASKNLVKWKSYCHQVVVESNEYFYKVYESRIGSDQSFDSVVRNCMASVVGRMGIEWNLVSFARNGKIFDFEQREKLKVASPDACSFSQLLESVANIYAQIEEMLEFDKVLAQLKQHEEFLGVEQLKLARACVNKHSDYALTRGGVILIDDAEFYVALVNENADVLQVPFFKEAHISLNSGDYIFKKLNSRTTKSGRVVVINSNMEEVFSGWVMVPVFDAEQSTVNSMAKCKEGDVSLMSVRDSQADTNIELVGFSGFAKRNVSDGREG